MYPNRVDDYRALEQLRESKLLVYITGDRAGWETQISPEVLDYFVDHLDKLGSPKKISLYLYSRGGNTLAGWSIVNLIRQFCDEFEIIVPAKAHSTGTLMCLGANNIVMTKQATLGPIDPSVNTPLNPQVPGGNIQARVPVSVEAIKGFLELAKDELNINKDSDLTNVLIKLADMVHPLVLGEVYRAKAQIQMLAQKLLSEQIGDGETIQRIVSFLVSDSGSHDYTIYRREARDHLGLTIEKPDDNLYGIIKRLYDDIALELQLNIPFETERILGVNSQASYSARRCLIDSVDNGSHVFTSDGVLYRRAIQTPNGQQTGIEDQRIFEGWRHEHGQ